MGGLKKIKNVFKAGSNDSSEAQAAAIAAAATTQADAIRLEGERQSALAKESAAAQAKQLQDQQVASNMALQQSMNQRTLSAQLEADQQAPEREAEIDLAPDVANSNDPRRKFQSNRASGVGIQIA
jgi:hypothetical protein